MGGNTFPICRLVVSGKEIFTERICFRVLVILKISISPSKFIFLLFQICLDIQILSNFIYFRKKHERILVGITLNF